MQVKDLTQAQKDGIEIVKGIDCGFDLCEGCIFNRMNICAVLALPNMDD